MTHSQQQLVTDPIEMHRQHWSEGIDLDILALLFTLHRAHEAVMAPGREIFAHHGLTPAEFDVLATLRRSPPPWELTPSEIQTLLFITSGGLTKVMDRLEARKLISRSRLTSDQRVRPAKLTASGKRLVEKGLAETMAAWTSQLRGTLTTKEIDLLTQLLGKLNSKISA